MQYESELAFAKELGQEAFKIAQKYYKQNPETDIKSDNSPVTIADEEINQLVIDRVKKEFPDHGILGEEQSYSLGRDYLWVCDPIDGTLPFAMGQPTFMFSIALVHKGDPVVSVLFDLSNGELYHAVKNNGAFLNDQRISVSKRSLSKSLHFVPSNLRNLFENKDFYLKLDRKVSQTNPVYGCVFKAVIIAEGLADASIWLRNVHPWDMAGVALLVTEAGGKVTDREGNYNLDFTNELNGIVLSNLAIHEELLAMVKDYDQKAFI